MVNVMQTIRRLIKSPGFTCVAVLTLGLCIGANLTIYSVLDAILVRSLPFPEPDRLVEINNAYPGAGIERGDASIANYFERREAIEAFEAVSMYRDRAYTIGEPGSPRRVEGARITPEFFATLGVPLAMGHAFSDVELDYGPDAVAIISHLFWQNHFNADPDVLGRTLLVDHRTVTVIGVLPKGFRYLSSKAQIFRPFAHFRRFRMADRRHSNVGQMIARLSENHSVAEAQAELRLFTARLQTEDPAGSAIKDSGYYASVELLHEAHVRSVRPVLMLVQISVLCLLLLGCLNIASLLLVRATGRSREIAVRQALGAGRWDIACDILVETTFLALLGSALGMLVGIIGVRFIEVLGVDALPLGANVTFDVRIALLAIVASIAVGFVIAIPMLWHNARETIGIHLQSESRSGTTSPSVQRLRHALVVAQIAVAFVLLCGAGLLAISLKRTLERSPGFESEQVLTAELSIASQRYPTNSSRVTFVTRLLDRLSALPGVTHAAVSSGLPFTKDGTVSSTIATEGGAATSVSNMGTHYLASVTPDYWQAMAIPLLEGRLIENSDLEISAPGVAVIDQALSRKYWPKGDAIGQRFSVDADSLNYHKVIGALESTFDEGSAYTIVGIVADVKQNDLAEGPRLGAVYLPYRHSLRFQVVLRTSVAAGAMGATMQRAILQLDPALPIDDVKTMQDRIDDSLVTRRSPAILAGVFSGCALLLAAIGTYGVLAYAVAQRRREIGVRIALGATRNQIGRQFMSLGLRLLAFGAIIGCLGGWMAGRAMQSILFDVPSFHVPTLTGVMLIMSVVTLVACLLPALRAAHVDPMEALRSE